MTQTELLTKTAVNSWKLVTARVDQMVTSMSDADLQREIAPGRNRVFYLIGHLVVTNDRLFPMLGLGDRLHPEMDAEFLENPDTHANSSVSAADLRNAWSEVSTQLTAAIEAMPPEQWLERHSAVSAEDFQKEPLRNRLAVLLSRTNHVSFHVGQIRLTH